jgi:hypothetical protein
LELHDINRGQKTSEKKEGAAKVESNTINHENCRIKPGFDTLDIV